MFTSKIATQLGRSQKRLLSVSLDGFGNHVFKGAVAEPYLKRHGLKGDALNNGKWTADGSADKVLLNVKIII
jgi:hypothetical protein